MKPAEVAVALERVRASFPSEALSLEGHIEALGTEDALLSVVREMIEAKEQSKAAEEVTAKILESWRPTMLASSSAIEKLAAEEKRRNDLKQREMDRQDKLDENRHEITKMSIKDMAVPVITAICSAIATAAAFWWSG